MYIFFSQLFISSFKFCLILFTKAERIQKDVKKARKFLCSYLLDYNNNYNNL